MVCKGKMKAEYGHHSNPGDFPNLSLARRSTRLEANRILIALALRALSVETMNPETEQARANAAAEEILRLIYGEDFEGCAVSFESVAAVILEAMHWRAATGKELLELHEKVAEAVDLLSTPPSQNSPDDPGGLLALLGERLDAIHTITQKLNQTAALIKSQPEDL